MNNLLIAAYKYLSNNVCVIPTNKNKMPAVDSWKEYQDTIITIEQAEQAFELPHAHSLSVICGKSSGGLEVIDVDVKYDLTGKLFENYVQDITDQDPDLMQSLLVVSTRNKGFHLYYRCSTVEGNKKLARRPASEEELTRNRNEKIFVLIETRGQGGYVVAPPSEGYAILQGEAIPTITPEQREMLFEIARSYNLLIETPVREYNTSVSVKEYFTTPWDDYNSRGDIIPLLQQHGWTIVRETSLRIIFRRPGKDSGVSGDYHKDKRLFKVFTTSSVFEEGQGYTHYRVFKVLECSNDPKLAGRRLLEMGYGEKRVFYGDNIERTLFKKKQEGLTNEQLAQVIVSKENKTEEEANEMVNNLNKIWGEKLCTFWDVDEKGKVTINRASLINFLNVHGGFALFYYDLQSTIFRIVQCKDGFLQEATTEYMKKFIVDYINHLPDSFDGGVTPDDIKTLLLKGHDTYFSSGILEFLPRAQYDLLKDEYDTAFFPFRNGVVKITKDAIVNLTYAEVNRVVWKSQIIDFDIVIDETDTKIAEYADFINCIAGESDDKYKYACALTGYLLHKYKDPGKPYCVILAEENDNETKGGGTGKGIYLTAISKLINTERVDGKNFKLDKNFAFQRVGLDTKLVAIEDTRKNVDFEGFYSIITEGITVEKKNKDELFIPYKDSPKIVFTTNYTIVNAGAHAQRRQRTFEFAPFFGVANTPAMRFGHNLFDDWDREEWTLFYNFLFLCVQEYLANGLQEQTSTIKVKRKHIRLKYGDEFLEWFDSYLEHDAQQWKFIGELYEDFINSSGTEKKFFSQKRFRMAINEWSTSLKNIPSEKIEGVQERRLTTSGKRTEIIVLKKGQDVKETDKVAF